MKHWDKPKEFSDSNPLPFMTKGESQRPTKEGLTALTSFHWWCFAVAAFILIVTSTLKLISIFNVTVGSAQAVALRSPSVIIPSISEGFLLTLGSAGEYMTAVILFTRINVLWRFLLLTWLSFVFLLYHFLLTVLFHAPTCHCLGIWHYGFQKICDTIGLILLFLLTGISLGGLLSCTQFFRIASKYVLNFSRYDFSLRQ